MVNRHRHLVTGALTLFVAAFLYGCFVKLPQTPEQLKPGTLPDGKIIGGDSQDSAAPGGDLPYYPDWSWWAPDGSSSPLPDGFTLPELLPEDGGDIGELVFDWICLSDQPADDGTFPELPPETFGGEVATHSFRRVGQVLGNANLLTVYYVVCQNEETYYVPERAYAFQVDEPTSVSFQLSCDDDCYAFLTSGGCEYDHFEGCWVAEDKEITIQEDLMPGLYLVGVEFPGAELEPPGTVHTFDLHAALNRTSGSAVCQTESATAASQLTVGSCAIDDEVGQASASVSGSLGWDDVDDFFLGCGPADAPADKLGGMPDDVHAFDADLPSGKPGTLSVKLTFPAGDPGSGHALALTGSPCGAAAAVIDCAYGDGSELVIEGVTVFPGERVYAVVDGIGDTAFEAKYPVDYELEWTLEAPCP